MDFGKKRMIAQVHTENYMFNKAESIVTLCYFLKQNRPKSLDQEDCNNLNQVAT